MRTVYVLMYWSDEDGLVNVPTGEKTPPKLKPYAVFEDSITAEKMKRDGDVIVKVPFFRNDCPDHLTITDKDLEGMPLNRAPWGRTYQPILCEDSTLSPPAKPYYRVTCQQTVNEHTSKDQE